MRQSCIDLIIFTSGGNRFNLERQFVSFWNADRGFSLERGSLAVNTVSRVWVLSMVSTASMGSMVSMVSMVFMVSMVAMVCRVFMVSRVST